ncbi:MAG: ABC transporter permease [Actinomycetota bacterium]
MDLLVGAGILGLIYAVVHLGRSMDVRYLPSKFPSTISTKPSLLPYYAARSLMRMFAAFMLSVAFTFTYGTAAARLRRGQKALIPLLDVLQSIPIFGFAFIAVTPFIHLFGINTSLGLEASAIFTVFTSQAWNMTFSFYHSLITQPRDLDEAARVMRLTRWERFWRLDVPSSMIGQVWNGMMSFGGGWFFLSASEFITFRGGHALPGVGSYISAALAEGNLRKIALANITMFIMILTVNFFFWRPLTAWADRFKVEETEAKDRNRSVVLDVLRRSSVPGLIGRPFKPVGEWLVNITRPFGLAEYRLKADPLQERVGDVAFWSVIGGAVGFSAWRGYVYLQHHFGFNHIPYVFSLGLITMSRVLTVVVLATLIWVPVGVWIGMNPRITRLAQPVVQILASYPAILLFPFITAFYLRNHIGLSYGSIVLMMMGSQWYILFNAIAGASAIPSDLREMMTNFKVPRRQKWRKLIIPAIFPAYVTGGITASGGAWNAAIVAEIVAYAPAGKLITLKTKGLGVYISQAFSSQSGPRMLAGIAIMSLFVVTLNRLLWRRLYRLAEARFSL